MVDFALEDYKLKPCFVALNVHACADSAWLNIGVTVGLGKEFPSYYVWNLVLAKSTFPWLSTIDGFLSLSKYWEISCKICLTAHCSREATKKQH